MRNHEVAPVAIIICRNIYVSLIAGSEGLMSVNKTVKLTMPVLLALLLLSYGTGSIRCTTIAGNSTDVLSLLDFKATTNDPRGALSSWNTSIHYCWWSGVKCNPNTRGRVTALKLAGQGLSGQITSFLGNLTDLHTLDLSSNNFSGQIPPLTNLQKLKYLRLGQNSLDGIIPDSLTNCSNLFYLDLSNNMLEGTIPPKIGFLNNLSVLAFPLNFLTGNIPSTLGNLTNLNIMLLANNKIDGNIPQELGQLSNLGWLSLSENNLSGGFPQGFFKNLSSLQILSIQTTLLGGTLPFDIGNTLPNLTKLFLADNMFEGHIPASLGNASLLRGIDLSLNNFTGHIPNSFGRLSGLSTLNLETNKLEARDNQGWEFLEALRGCNNLNVLSLADNLLFGDVPNSIGGLSINLTILLLGRNNLTGIVPLSIGNLQGLISLGLDNNGFSGTIEWIGKLKNLQSLCLRNNNFTGPIPYSIGKLTQLTELYLRNNAFEGHIPPSLGNPQLLLKLDLSYNKLQGTIPLEISNLRQLIYLQLASNKLNGEIPDALGMCQNLVTIQMDQNFLRGDMPISFGNLNSLTILNISHNNLSGTIPVALGYLPLLSKLDLSYNNLQGEVPTVGVFRNVTSAYLDGNSRLCGGVTDLHMLSCPQVSNRIKRDSDITKRDYNLVRLLVPIFGFVSLTVLIYLTCLAKRTSRRTDLLLLSFGKQFPRVSYKDLAQATGKFSESNLIGRGSYSSVYRAKLAPTKLQVALKVFDLEVRCADKSFLSECEVLRSIRHRNLLPVLTACSTIDNSGNAFKALIYEYMPNGNLNMWLHKQFASVASKCLSLAQRVNIAVDIANALSYLHHECERSIVHCDLKPTNILLDDDMNAYLGDFGISNLVIESRVTSLGHSSPNSSIGLKGTIGYIAPGIYGYFHIYDS